MANGSGGQTLRNLQPGEYLCFQGQASDEIFVLRSGTLNIYVIDEEGIATGEQVESGGILVGVVDQPGSFIGEIGAILKERRSASIRVSEDGPAQVMVINLRGKGFDATVLSNPKIGFSLSKTIAQRLGVTSNSITRSDTLTFKAKDQIEHFSKWFYELINELAKTAETQGKNIALVEDARKMIPYQIGRMIDKYGYLPIDLFSAICLPFATHQTIFHNRIFSKGAAGEPAPEASGEPKPGVSAFAQGDVICPEGSTDTNLYFLLAGKLEVFVGLRSIETIAEKGAIFGENAMFGDLARSSGVRALSTV
ncbi:MAG TPA: cyclic nucleotide-binding domain-containing protein, partial [bacterium]|nr:cyclic nucleotide-binding domain-containing protein [bacterium]